jgi:polygalacturonase
MHLSMFRVHLTALTLAVLNAARLPAQDSRRVTEPTVPAACTVLPALLSTVGDTTIAEADETRPDTKRMQDAIDRCSKGSAVVLRGDGTRRAFLSGPLELRDGVTLQIDSGAILFASRNPRDYDVTPHSCGVVSEKGHGCRALINGDRLAGAAVIGPGTIDGRGWAPLAGSGVSWWELAEQARVSYRLSQNCPRLIVITRSSNFTLYNIRLKNSPNFHVVFDRGDGFTAWGVLIDTPKHARNTDGIDPMSSTNVTITHSSISTGDDNLAIKAGSTGPSMHLSIEHNHFYSGHGMSIGSETNGGVSAIRVSDLSIDGADNGLRIKSNSAKGGLVHDVEYRDVCIRDTKNPIYMDTHYSASAQTTGSLVPVFRDIRFKDVRLLGGGKITLDGYDSARRLEMIFDNVTADHPNVLSISAAHTDVRIGPGPTNLSIGGPDVHLSGIPGESQPNGCAGKFVPLATERTASTTGRPAAIVDAHFTGREGDTISGTPTYRSIGDALTQMPLNGGGRAIIFVRNGRYHEKLTVDRPRVSLVGESRDSTILSYDAAADTPSPGGGTYGTRGSFTLRIQAPDFRAENMTIENAFNYPTNAAKPDGDPTRLRNQQAVALMLDTGSDRATFVNVRISGYQDTLFPNAGRSYFYKCEILGHVDFIFGAGQAVFDSCDIVSRDRGSTTNNGYVTAPSTSISQPYGFVFIHCRLLKDRTSMAPNSVTLGRPWHPFADPDAVGSAVYIDCWMDDHIGAKGWDRMSSVDSTGMRLWYEPESARFYEYGTRGPGAVTSPTRRVLSAAEAARYTPANVLRGWIPALPSTRTST